MVPIGTSSLNIDKRAFDGAQRQIMAEQTNTQTHEFSVTVC